MKNKTKYIGLTVMLLIGLSILLYPAVSDLWNRFRSKQLMTRYQNSITEGNTEYDQLKKEAEEYNQNLVNGTVSDAFSVDEDISDTLYESLLNINGDGIMGSVEIPSIDVNLPIYHYTKEESLKKGAGHLLGSSLPVGGESTHSVITAHRGLPGAELFTDLNLVKEGDVFYIHVLDETLAYQVDQILTVKPTETEALSIETGKDYVTLLTCTPYAVNSHRLLVRGFRIPYEEESYEASIEKREVRIGSRIWITILCAVGGAGAAVLAVKWISKKEAGRDEASERDKK